MLLPGRRRHLRRRAPLTGLALWAALVLGAHAWIWLEGRERLAAANRLPPIERLQVKLQQPFVAQPPPAAPGARTTRRLEEGQARRPSQSSPALSPLEREPERALPALAALPEIGLESASASALGPDGVGSEWPLSTRLRYEVVGHYRGEVHGDAEVEWLRQGERYQVRLKIGIGPSAAPFVARELVSEGVITPEGISPRRYDEQTRVLLGKPRRVSLSVHEGRLHLANGRETLAPPGLQDSASQFVQIAWLLTTGRVIQEPGAVIELPLALPQVLLNWRYELVGSERTETPLGKTELFHWRPQGAVPAGALAAEVWLAPAMQHLPVRIRISQGRDTWLNLSLLERPLQEEVPAAENAASASEGSPR